MMKYRPDIDGLRAIAIIGVLLFHLDFANSGYSIFCGGFIGVDIFFVISGYLITKILSNQIESTGHFSILDFYERRIRRLYPVLLCVMIACLPLAWLLLSPNFFYDFSQSSIATLFSVSNFHYYISLTSYGADLSILKPLLHSWSLGIEMQFYIAYPIILYILIRYFNNNIFAYILFFIFSFIASLWLSTTHPDLNFYNPLSRFWQFIAGAIVAHHFTKKLLRFVPNKIIQNSLTITAFFTLSGFILFYDGRPIFDPSLAIIPIICTALLILISSPELIVTRMLSNRVCGLIGKISYSLYLWHFPLLAFAFIYNPDMIFTVKIAWLLFVFILSIITYHLIEKPFRSHQAIPTKSFFAIITIATIGLLSFHTISIKTNGMENRIPTIFQGDFAKPWNRFADKNNVACFNRTKDFCEIINDPNAPWIIMVGDSHMAAIENNLVKQLSDTYNYLSMNVAGCWFADNTIKMSLNDVPDSICTPDLNHLRLAEIKKRQNATVIIGGRLPVYLSSRSFDNQEGGYESEFGHKFKSIDTEKTFKDNIIKTLQEVLNENHQVILIYPIPEVGWNVTQKLLTHRSLSKGDIENHLKLNPVTTSYDVYKQRTQESFDLLSRIDNPNIARVYPHQIFCDHDIVNRCITHTTTDIYYSDDDHPSDAGARLINFRILAKLHSMNQ